MLNLLLTFEHSLPVPGSTLPVVLTTDGPGSKVDTRGNVALVGTGTFTGGILNNYSGTVSIKGQIAPVP
jgi:hypothetical protein